MDFTDLLDVLGGLALIAFAYLVFAPAALLVFGVMCLAMSWQRTRTQRPTDGGRS